MSRNGDVVSTRPELLMAVSFSSVRGTQARLRESLQLVGAHGGFEPRVDNPGHPVAPRPSAGEEREYPDAVVQLVDGLRDDHTCLPAGGAEHLVVAGHGRGVRCRRPGSRLRAPSLVGDDGLGRLPRALEEGASLPGIEAFEVQGDDLHGRIAWRNAPEGPRPSRRTCCRSSPPTSGAGMTSACR